MPDIAFKLSTEYIEMFKLLKLCGLCESGGAAKHAIAGGGVTVDGQVEIRKAFKVRAGHVVVFEGQTIRVN